MSDTTSTSPPSPARTYQTRHCSRAAKSWAARKAHAEAHNTWISTFFANNTVSVKTKGKVERWIIGAQIGSEKEHRDEKDTDWPYDASAVVECTSRESNGESTHAIAKIYMQIPYYTEEHGQTSSHRKTPSFIIDEIRALKRMSRLGHNAPGPQLLGSRCTQQATDMWVPGGFLSIIVMQKLPGIALTPAIYSSMSSEEQEDICLAFKCSWENMTDVLRIHYSDARIRNLLWDGPARKCYIVDYEVASFLPEEGDCTFWPEVYVAWGLKRPRMYG